MRRLLTVLVLALTLLSSLAQTTSRKIKILGRVYDAFTEMYVPDTKVTLMSVDSVVIDTTHVETNRLNEISETTYYTVFAPAQPGKYIVKLENKNYKTCYVNVALKRLARQTSVTAPDAKMSLIRKKGGLFEENELGEVTVKATKVQFFYKGDTIVYNADAFNLPEGSMLDALIKQMPGAELKENGEILINGRKIDYLTLNGKKMFNGKGQVLLQNLPHYSVKDLRVFEKDQENLIGSNRESVVKDYVMDVSLKREYDQSNFGHVELGAGTKERRIGRLFDTYNREGFLAMGYANLNNVNQTREPGEDGTFSDSDGPRSIVDNKQFGMSTNLEKSQGNFAHILTLMGQVKKTDMEFQRKQQTFLSQGDVFKNTAEKQYNRISAFNASNELIFRKPFFIYSRTNMNYDDGKERLNNSVGTYRNAISLGNHVNQSSIERLARNHSLYLEQKFWLYKSTSWGDEMQLKAGVSYKEGKDRSKEAQRIVYPRMELDSLYEYLANENIDNKGYSFNADAMYKFNFLNGMGLELDYNYMQDNERKDRMRIRNSEEDNCYHSNTIHRENQPGLVLSYQHNQLTLTSGVRLRMHSYRIGYEREELDTLMHRNYMDFFPDLRIKWNFGKNRISFYTKYNSYEKPTAQDLVEKIDDTNPLFMTRGNGNLKKSSMYDYQFTYNYRGGKHDFSLMFNSQSQFCFNSIVRGMLYDESRGSYLVTPYNVNGVWYSFNMVRLGSALNAAKSLRFQNSTKYTFLKSVEMSGTTITGLEERKANSQSIEDELVLAYQHKKTTVRLVGSVKYQGSRGEKGNDNDYDAWDIHYGMNWNCNLPWSIQLSGDIGMYSRKGYGMKELNKDNLLANLSLSRSFLKNKLLLKLRAFDVFHELTSIERNISSMQVEETAYHCIPRYGMISLTYRFGKAGH